MQMEEHRMPTKKKRIDSDVTNCDRTRNTLAEVSISGTCKSHIPSGMPTYEEPWTP